MANNAIPGFSASLLSGSISLHKRKFNFYLRDTAITNIITKIKRIRKEIKVFASKWSQDKHKLSYTCHSLPCAPHHCQVVLTQGSMLIFHVSLISNIDHASNLSRAKSQPQVFVSIMLVSESKEIFLQNEEFTQAQKDLSIDNFEAYTSLSAYMAASETTSLP